MIGSIISTDGISGQAVVPGTVQRNTGSFDGSAGVFQGPVAAHGSTSRHVRRSTHFRLRRIGNILQEGDPPVTGSHITAVEHQIPFRSNVIGKDCKGICIRHILGSQNHTAVISVGKNMNGIITLSGLFQKVFNLHKSRVR